MRSGVCYGNREPITKKARTGYLQDSDVRQLLSLKTNMFRLYNYQVLKGSAPEPKFEDDQEEYALAIKQH